MQNKAFTFDEATHTYRHGGREIVGVTRALGGFMEIDVEGTQYFVDIITGAVIRYDVIVTAGHIGTAVHKAMQIIANGGEINWVGLDPQLIEPVTEFIRWQDDWQPQYLLVEKPMLHPTLGFAGTPDIICKLRYNGRLVTALVDVKTVTGSDKQMAKSAGPQTAAYEVLYRYDSKHRGPLYRFALRLPKKGGPYKFVLLNNPNDQSYFMNRLHQHQYLNQD